MNKEKLVEYLEPALKGNAEAIAVVREVLRPRKEDTVDLIEEKLRTFIKIIFHESLKYKDAPFHRKIDRAYAEQVHSYLNTGTPRYRGMMIIGYKESAKTTRVKFCEIYLALYLPEHADFAHIVSENGDGANQFNMDLFNILAFSRTTLFFPDVIDATRRTKKKESQTMSRFSTTTGVTYVAKAARITTRGGVKVDVTDDGAVETKRPKKVIFDDIENEVTVRSLAITQQIGDVMNATIDSLDQATGSWVLLGNYFSLRGNVHKFIEKYRRDDSVFTLMIAIVDELGNPTWPDKYARTDDEVIKLAEAGIQKVSIEQIERTSDNFSTEFLNNPQRFAVYFGDDLVSYLGETESKRVSEKERKPSGELILREPEQSGTYVIGVDAAKGVGADQSAVTVIRLDGIRFEDVANFVSNTITPENLAPVVTKLATQYNHALVVPENNYPGNEFIAFLRQTYSNIYYSKKIRNEAGEYEYDYGINTNLKTKPEYFLSIKRVLRDRLLTINSESLYEQILEYPHTDVHEIKHRDGGGGHFDLLLSFAIAIHVAPTLGGQSVQDEEVDAKINRIVRDVFNSDRNHR